MRTCSKQINNCSDCENAEKCIKCENNYYMINNITNKCININEITPIDEYYLNENNSTYFSCNKSEYNSIQNCKKCINKNSCSLCNNGFTFIEGNKSLCHNIEELENKYYPDANDESNYLNCSNLVDNCFTCNSSQCFNCKEGYIFINDNFLNCLLISSIDLSEYYTNDNVTYYSCKDDKYKNNSKCLSKISIIDTIQTTINKNSTIPIVNNTTIPILESTIKNIESTIYIKNSTTLITTIPFLESTINDFKSTPKTNTPIINSTINYIKSTIYNKNSTTPIIQTNTPNIKSSKIKLSSSIINTYSDIDNISSSLKSSMADNSFIFLSFSQL